MCRPNEPTSKMLEAGAQEFLAWEGLMYGTARSAALAIFTAMVEEAPKAPWRRVGSVLRALKGLRARRQ